MKNDIIKQIKNITRFLIDKNLVISYNEPRIMNDEITLKSDISKILKNEEYSDIYNICIKEKLFNFLLLDTAILQLMYRFDKRGRSIIEHRLCFFPNPNIEQFAENFDYESLYYESRNIAIEYIEKNVVIFPLRFDFNINEQIYKEIYHPKSHLTLGNYKNCRIPVSSWISPKMFVGFILRNFYNTKFLEIQREWDNIERIYYSRDNFLSDREKKILHLNYV